MIQGRVLEIITSEMKLRRVTQLQLADALGYSQATISQILNGKTRLTVEDLGKIASALDMQVTEIFAKAEQASTTPLELKGETSRLACEDDINFQLFNILKQPIHRTDLIQRFPKRFENQVREKIEAFKQMEVFLEDLNGNLSLNVADAASLHYEITDDYNRRIVNIYERIRPTIGNIVRGPARTLASWKEENLDSFYVEYFSKHQIKEQNRYLRQFLAFLKQQLAINRLDKKRRDPSERYELRSIFISSVPYPELKE